MPDNFISAVRGYLRLGNFPLDASSVYSTLDDAETYVSQNPTAYPGQLVAVADEDNETVTVYQVSYRSGGGLELQSLVANATGNVRSINGILPDINGNITLDLDHLDLILTFLEDTEDRVIFSKAVSVDTTLIEEDDDVITKKYLESSIDLISRGTLRTLSTTFDEDGGTTTQIIPGGAVIKKAVLKITEVFDQADITILINSSILFGPSDIFETETGIFVLEPMVRLSGDASNEYPVVITVDSSTKGLAELYIDFNVDYIQ
jgi:hypothetical protein